jgi:hypothetical protein
MDAKPEAKSLYETDGYTWAMRQADALRRRAIDEIDWDNVAEEVESVGKTEARELESRLEVLLVHLLKWQFQPDKRTSSWKATIKEQRLRIARHLEQNPGLRAKRDEYLGAVYAVARLEAATQTGMTEAAFPDTNPFTFAQAMDEAFWPE